jgi:hypothetical protein
MLPTGTYGFSGADRSKTSWFFPHSVLDEQDDGLADPASSAKYEIKLMIISRWTAAQQEHKRRSFALQPTIMSHHRIMPRNGQGKTTGSFSQRRMAFDPE